jgi:hypothetical protein
VLSVQVDDERECAGGEETPMLGPAFSSTAATHSSSGTGSCFAFRCAESGERGGAFLVVPFFVLELLELRRAGGASPSGSKAASPPAGTASVPAALSVRMAL